MPKVVITHGVADVDTWLSLHQERADAIAGIGGRNVVDQVAFDGSGAVAVSCEHDDVASLMATLADPPAELGEIMGRHGVQPPLVAYVEK
jgi:hypothetical protein